MDIIVWEWKHGSLFYDASTPEKKEASALKILRQLIEEMQYWYEPQPEHYTPWKLDEELAHLTDEQVDALPTASLQEQANAERRKLAAADREYKTAKAEWDTVQKILDGETLYYKQQVYNADDSRGRWKKGDLAPRRRVTAWGLIQARGGGEYENFSIESVWSPDDE